MITMTVKHTQHPRPTAKAGASTSKDKPAGKLGSSFGFVKSTRKTDGSIRERVAQPGRKITEPPLSVEEAIRRFDVEAAKARAAQIAWIEAMGPPDGWVRLSDLPVDDKTAQGHTQTMNDITREEFNARMETIEVKMDARVEAVSGKIDAFIAVQAERDKRMEAIVSQISATHTEIKTSINSMKTTTIVTAVSAVLAIVIGIAGFNAMLTSNMIASFQMGRSERALETPAVQKIEPSPPSAPQK